MLTELEELGLTHNEALVYQALAKLGESKIGPIVKATKMHRVLIYNALDALEDKGLTSTVIKENIKYFQITDASRIIDFLEEKKEIANKILPQLQSLQEQSLSKQEVSVFSGIKGLKSAMNAMLKELNTKAKHYVFASGNMAPTMGAYYELFQETKKKKKVKTKVIYDQTFKKQKTILKKTYGDIKFYPLSPFPTDTWMYNDKVLIVTYTAIPPIAILIQSQETATSYKKLFESLWKKAKD